MKKFYENVKSDNVRDEFYSPAYAIEPIEKFLNPNSKVWCPFDTKKSEFVKYLRYKGHNVLYSHIFDDKDFFTTPIPECDYIISNPPWSKKNEIFARLFEINKPFAMLIGSVGIFDSQFRFNMFNENKFEMLYLSPRISYFKEIDDTTTKNSPPFQSVYICHNILPELIMFREVDKSKLRIQEETCERTGILFIKPKTSPASLNKSA